MRVGATLENLERVPVCIATIPQRDSLTPEVKDFRLILLASAKACDGTHSSCMLTREEAVRLQRGRH